MGRAGQDEAVLQPAQRVLGQDARVLGDGQIPDDDDLGEQLISLDYGYDARFRIQLQSKKDLKKMGVNRPTKPIRWP